MRRVVAAAFIGSALEWYDFSIYGTASALVFSDLFFPKVDAKLGLLAAVGTYAIGFCARPIGAVFFGHLGDRYGRKGVLLATIVLMGAATFAIGVLPTYRQIGFWAPVLLLVLRILQGFGGGAEQAGASLVCAEFAPAKRRGLIASLAFAGIILGTLLAALVFSWVANLPQGTLYAWGWCVPFLLSAVVIAIGIYIRVGLRESPAFEHVKEADDVASNPIGDAVRSEGRRILSVLGLRIGENGTSYLVSVLALSYVAHTLRMGGPVGAQALVVSSAVGLVLLPFWGWLSDLVGRRPVFRYTALFLALFAFPFVWLLDTRVPWLVYSAFTLAMTVGVWGMYSVEAAYFPELFRARHRYSALAISKEIGAVLGGGLAPVLGAALLLWAGGWALAAYIVVLGGISFASTFTVPETKGRDLTAG
ncbi:MHS family MFS transporter [Streptomyces sp. RB6PN25]|uniref:MHS family MFS transporter n=1 Tax=Streptomyces humicola TaxID=2953240 RepID=A0ABT1PUN6_9ACTN|nr:MFS transporter [Streptomyces humicola]MCQ4080858.1 MHS family MFS transporter [Streptomyces humicola]